MKNRIPLLLAFYLLPFISFAQLSLTIQIKDLRSSKGQILVELLDGEEKQVAGINKKTTKNNCVFVFENLPPGKYAFKLIHDENGNKKLDTNWLGIPKEGIAFSNSPKMTFGPPSFEKIIFELNESAIIECKPYYYLN